MLYYVCKKYEILINFDNEIQGVKMFPKNFLLRALRKILTIEKNYEKSFCVNTYVYLC